MAVGIFLDLENLEPLAYYRSPEARNRIRK